MKKQHLMKTHIASYIENVLSKIAILDEPEVAFENIEILEFRTHYENGTIFRHQNGDNYALAILNAITEDSYFEISKTIKKSPNLSVKNLEDLVAEHYLKCYIAGTSPEYKTWKSGDLGAAYLKVDDENKSISVGFINETTSK